MKQFLMIAGLLMIAAGTNAQATRGTNAQGTRGTNAQGTSMNTLSTDQASTSPKHAADPKMTNSAESIASSYSGFLAKELGLNEKQSARTRELFTSAEEEVASLRAQSTKIRMQMEAAYEPYFQQMSSYLTPAQSEKFKQLKRSGAIDTLCGKVDGEHCGHDQGGTKSSGCCAGPKSAAGTTPTPSRTSSVTPSR